MLGVSDVGPTVLWLSGLEPVSEAGLGEDVSWV